MLFNLNETTEMKNDNSGSLARTLVAEIVVTWSARYNLCCKLVAQVTLDIAIMLAVRISNQLHTALWTEERGVSYLLLDF